MARAHGSRADAYAREIARRAPGAWVINFTNPVGIVTQAMHAGRPNLKIVGICDTPTELFAEIAHALERAGRASARSTTSA